MKKRQEEEAILNRTERVNSMKVGKLFSKLKQQEAAVILLLELIEV